MQKKILKMEYIPEKLLKYGIKKKYRKNEVILRAGDNFAGIYILIKGSVLIYNYSKQGKINYELLLVPPCIIGDGHTINNRKSYSNFKCLEDVEIVFIEKNEFLKILELNFDLTLFIFNSIDNKFRIYASFAEQVGFLKSEQQVYNLLLELVEHFGIEISGKLKINYHITQQFISNLLGINRSSTVEAFNHLKEQNVIEIVNGYYYINDLKALMNEVN